MRRLYLGMALAALLFAGSFGARADYGYSGSYGYLMPTMATGCFGEVFPALQLVMPDGYGDSSGFGQAGSAPPGWGQGGPGRKGVDRPGGGKGIERPAGKGIERPSGGKGLDRPGGGKAIEGPGGGGADRPAGKGKKGAGGEGSDKPGDDEVRLPSVHRLTSRGGSTPRSLLEHKPVREAGAKLDLRGLTAKDAERLFWAGCKYYWQGEYDEALAHVDAATELFADDARFWYYRSLSEAALGLEKRAESSLRQAVQLHLRGLPSAAAISQALERVQGEPRMRLREALDAAQASR